MAGHDPFRHFRQALQQRDGVRQFVGLSGCEVESDGTPGAVGHHERPLCRSRHESGQALHGSLALLQIPLSAGARRLLMSADVGPVQEHHAEPDAALLNQRKKPLPDAEPCPADEGLRRHPPWTELGRKSTPLRPVLMAPKNCLHGPAKVRARNLRMRAAHFDQRFQIRPLLVAQHPSFSSSEKPAT